MKIAVLSGSPKGELSITLQYVRYLERILPDHEWEILHISRDIQRLEKDPKAWQGVVNAIAASKAVLWASPVYYYLVPSQLKRFIELAGERGVTEIFREKYAAVLLTSVHFFDNTAAEYLHGICDDWGMAYTGEFLAEMNDLAREEHRRNLLFFAGEFLRAAETSVPVARRYEPLPAGRPPCHHAFPGALSNADALSQADPPPQASNTLPRAPRTETRRIVILTDGKEGNLGAMVDAFAGHFPEPVQIVDLQELAIQGGCLGCLHCGYDNRCVYNDDVQRILDTIVAPSDAVVFAGAIVDRFLSSRWKRYLDRSFVYGHIKGYEGKQIAYIISGPLRALPNLQIILEAYAQVSGGHHVGIVTDEEPERAAALLVALAERMIRSIDARAQAPAPFWGTGGRLIFRDLVYRLRGIFAADHRFFRRNGLYDYPHKELGNRSFQAFLSFLSLFPPVRKNLYGRMKENMLMSIKPYADGKE
ncbi:hypothetical protein GTO91_11580 [Heliobacterium undosum]|uniref:NADPH-dependent FMN reductase-like domain-containing protein n=1 Tax=Heliomicrobium undosum TaxID=121734 RepID=A0A845L1C0_9FIRM|nr:NAD(P)H-dependent oxidoreductase [Heliomicrobium undosum]MZP30352.1 hypothetical protein [Heliomicrobium undosum]